MGLLGGFLWECVRCFFYLLCSDLLFEGFALVSRGLQCTFVLVLGFCVL